jgi:hypothetical protein
MRRIPPAILITLGMLAVGCGDSESQGESGPKDTFVVADAPAPIELLPDATDCGTAESRLGDRKQLGAPMRCFVQARRAGDAAAVKVTTSTVEGAPIHYYLWARPESDDLLWVVDNTEDHLGSQRWLAMSCAGIGSRGLPFDCTNPLDVENDTPVELLQRAHLPNCGKLSPAVTELAAQRVRECVEAKLGAEGAEYRITEPAEEHPVERIVRLLPEDVQVFENSGGYSPTDNQWTLSSCDVVDQALEPRGCGEPQPLASP